MSTLLDAKIPNKICMTKINLRINGLSMYKHVKG